MFYLCNVAKVIQEIMLKWSFYALCYLILIVTCAKQKRKSFCQEIILTSLHLFPCSVLFCWKYKLRLVSLYKELIKNNFVLFQNTSTDKLDFLAWHATCRLSSTPAFALWRHSAYLKGFGFRPSARLTGLSFFFVGDDV